jgi:hypothetical protein
MKLLAGLLMMNLWMAATVAAQTDPTAEPAGVKVLLRLSGVGVQIYACKNGAAGPGWSFVAPQAKLLDGATEAGTHSAGPTWTLKDGSSVKGEVIGTSSPNAGAISWLLLKAAGTGGSGQLSEVKFIRRSDTEGGKAPATGCDANHLDSTVEVPYKAIYTFYVAGR